MDKVMANSISHCPRRDNQGRPTGEYEILLNGKKLLGLARKDKPGFVFIPDEAWMPFGLVDPIKSMTMQSVKGILLDRLKATGKLEHIRLHSTQAKEERQVRPGVAESPVLATISTEERLQYLEEVAEHQPQMDQAQSNAYAVRRWYERRACGEVETTEEQQTKAAAWVINNASYGYYRPWKDKNGRLQVPHLPNRYK